MPRHTLGLIVAFSFGAVALSACQPSEEMRTGFARYQGEPVSELVARLGPATGEQTIQGDHAYVWSTNGSLETSRSACALRVKVDADQRITAGNWDGNYGACNNVAQKLLGER
jgi:hypothetical protein